MIRAIRRFINQPRMLRWKLTLSYTVVTVAALLVIEVIVILGLATYVARRSDTTPKELVDSLNASYVPIARRFLSKNPPDVHGLQEYLKQREVVVVDVEPIRLGDFIFEVSSTNILYVVLINSDGTLIDTLPHGFLNDTVIGEVIDTDEIVGLAGPLRAAQNGADDVGLLTIVMPRNAIIGAIPIVDSKDDERILGALAFERRSDFWQVLTLATLARQLGVGFLFIIVFAGVLGMAIGSWTARGLTSRLKRVLVSARAWGKGDFSAHVADASDDELGQLAQALNRMAVKLESLLEERHQISVMEERNRLARDLHDSVKQQAFAASAQLGAARAHFKPDPPEAELHLLEADKLLDDVREELTDLIQELRPAALQGRGLVLAVKEYVANQSQIEIDLRINGDRRLPLSVEQALFRIIQGGVSNVIRHSQAMQATVELTYKPTSILLIIADNGIGFDVDSKNNGIGLRSIRERVELLNGRLEIRSRSGEGTEISVHFIA